MKKTTSEVLKLDNGIKRICVRLMKPFANNFILLNPRCKAIKNKVNLNFWDGKPNLGDAISPIVVEYMLGLKNLSLTKTVDNTKHLYAIGSVITAGIQNCTVWGSGILYTTLGYRLKNRKLDIRSVRGPMTRMVLIEYGYDVPEIYGDPAIFMPEIYFPHNIKKQYKYGIVSHKNGSKHLDDLSLLDNDYKLIDIKTNDYKVFINDLLSVEYVISTSLHGIILAESYGISAILVQPEFSLFKYYDWYCGTGRAKFPMLQSLKELKTTDFLSVPDLKELRDNLRNTFPYDLF